VVATVTDPDLLDAARTQPGSVADVYTAAAAAEMLDGRAAVAARLTAGGAVVVDAPPSGLAWACVTAI